jgi:hypothetical protein
LLNRSVSISPSARSSSTISNIGAGCRSAIV